MRVKLFLLEHAQELRLHLERHVADLVAAAACRGARSRRSFALLVSIGVSAALVAEQLAFPQSLGIAVQLMVTERYVRRVPVVCTARDTTSLAGAVLAHQEHGGIEITNLAHEIDDRLAGCAAPE
jgi:hypothetical protein